jgi:hypothetical protein
MSSLITGKKKKKGGTLMSLTLQRRVLWRNFFKCTKNEIIS